MKGKWKKKGHFEFHFFRSVTPEVKTWFLERLRLVGGFGESRDLVFSPSRSNLGLVRSRLAGFVRNREIYNLGMVSGPVLLKIKGKCWIFILLGSTKKRKTNTKWTSGTKSVKCWSPELLMIPKRCGSSARIVFQNPQPEKPNKKQKNNKNRRIFPVFPVICGLVRVLLG